MNTVTNPSIAALSGGGLEAAIEANNSLWAVGGNGSGNLNQGMTNDTSPGIAGLVNGGYEIAFQANTNDLVTIGMADNTSWNFGMNPVTSPSIMAG
jgi:hypothetical protein